MFTLIFMILGGLLVRADGWGPENDTVAASWPKWKLFAAKFFNAITCSLIVAGITAILTTPLTGLAVGLAFWLFRAPGFDGWTNWLHMYWRGFWPTFIGFTALSLLVHNAPYFGLLSLPFAALYMLTYVGGYKWMPETILGYNRHVWIEHISGWLFIAHVLFIFNM